MPKYITLALIIFALILVPTSAQDFPEPIPIVYGDTITEQLGLGSSFGPAIQDQHMAAWVFLGQTGDIVNIRYRASGLFNLPHPGVAVMQLALLDQQGQILIDDSFMDSDGAVDIQGYELRETGPYIIIGAIGGIFSRVEMGVQTDLTLSSPNGVATEIVLPTASLSSGGTIVSSKSAENLVEIAVWEGKLDHSSANVIKWSPDASVIATGTGMWAFRDGEVTLFGGGGSIQLWDAESHELVRQFAPADEAFSTLAFSPDGSLIAGGGIAGIWIWDMESGEEVHFLEGHTMPIGSVEFSPDGSLLASGSSDNTAKIWDVESGEEIMSIEAHTETVVNVAWSPDGSYLATASADLTTMVWDISSGDPIATLEHPEWIRPLAWSPDGTYLATASGDGGVRLWDTETWELVTTFEHEDWIAQIVWLQDSSGLITYHREGDLQLWDTTTFEPTVLWTIYNTTLYSVKDFALSPDGTVIGLAQSNIVTFLAAP